MDIAEDGHALTGLRYNRGAWFVVITHRWDSTQLNSWGVEFYCPAEHSQYAKFRLAVADAMASHRVVTNKAQKALSFTL